ncbi:MAG: dicarboxylate/amino acid:cation symporter [Candidatus Caenarcaniphilales bacterium]|nr:dicarboxylate/amino acid:cation symporter [Candidatus Caenarcaniphilales bacterium]
MHSSEENNISSKPGLALHWQIMIGMVLGIMVGAAFGTCNNSDHAGVFCSLVRQSGFELSMVSWMGDLFLKLLKLIVVPLIFCALINGISHMRVNQLGKVGLITFLVFKGSMLIAAVLGLVFVNAIQPGVGFDVSKIGTTDLSHFISQEQADNLFLESIPSNVVKALSGDSLIQVIFIAIVFGIALVQSGKSAESIVKVIEQIFKIILKITHWIMMLAPYGVFGLISQTVGTAGFAPFVALAKYMLVVTLGLGTMLFVVTPLLVFFLGGMSPWRFFGGVKDAMITAFSTSSSAATLPVSLECVSEKLGVPQSLSSFVVTIGATMSMNGAALYESVVTLFLAQAYAPFIPGIDLSLQGQIVIVGLVLLSTIGTPGIPHGGLVTTTIVLKAVKLPIDAIGLIIGVDRILDMCRTMVNVTGDCAAAVIVNNLIGDKERQNFITDSVEPEDLELSSDRYQLGVTD